MKRTLKIGALLGAFVFGALLGGCAQDVGDIDRTQPNKLLKSDLEGVWWIGQKITDVPSTTGEFGGFEGLQMELDKVVLVAEEKYLIAYRSYPHLPGSENTDLEVKGENSYESYYGKDYRGSILAMYPIEGHFDVKRTYDAQTGEQSNVIEENSHDRPWYDRDYIRVDWSGNPLVNFDMMMSGVNLKLGTNQTAEVNAVSSPYFEYDDEGNLLYFDAPALYVAEPSIWDCVGGQMLGWWYGECGSGQVRVVTSFMKDDGSRDYEPLPYDDKMMNRFGYFRSEQYTYDSHGGIYNEGRKLLANRHNIWKQSYTTNANGEKEAIPVEEREIRTAPYYIRNMPKDEFLRDAALKSIHEWNRVFKLAYKNMTGNEANADFFVPCHIPVADGDNPVCGNVGYAPREGDMRKNVLWLVDQRTDAGLLGYGPGAADPLTGETLSANAHVYLSAVSEVSGAVLEQIKYHNGDLDIKGVINNEYLRGHAKDLGEKLVDMSRVADAAHRTPIGMQKEKDSRRLAKRDLSRQMLKKFDGAAFDAKLKKVAEAGLLDNSDNNSLYKHIAKIAKIDISSLPENVIDQYSPASMFSMKKRQYERSLKEHLTADRVMCFKEMMDARLTGFAKKYEGRVDYDRMWREIRAEVLYSTSIHEMGHSFGLRHNFSASYDSLNYFDKYWELRKDANFLKEKKTIGDMYALYDFSKEQLEGNMLGQQYSSIMDYQGYTVENQGLGKYDEAAIAFAYSAGTSKLSLPEAECKKRGGSLNAAGSCLVMRNGIIEVFDKTLDQLGKAGRILNHTDTTLTSTFDDPTSIGQAYLELVHYSTFMNSFPEFDDAFNRKWMRLDDYLAEKNAEDNSKRHVRVPYLFCTDHIAGKIASCQRFDHGADLYHQMKNTITDYRAYYPFTDFARGRAYWWYGNAVNRHIRTFLQISDYFQNWFISDNSLNNDIPDEFNDELNMTAVRMGFNFLTEVIATPEYGLFCKRSDNGHVYPLSGDVAKTPDQTSEFYKDVYCGENPEYFYVRQGDGRTRYIKYDRDAGYDYEMFERENGHVYTTWYAALALFDNEADVIAPGGDIGTYTFGMYDFFDADIALLSNSIIAEDYSVHSPILALRDKDGNSIEETWVGESYPSGTLVYPRMAKTWTKDETTIDPETGALLNNVQSQVAGLPAGAKCVSTEQCSSGNPDVESRCTTLYTNLTVKRCYIIYPPLATDVNCPEDIEYMGDGSIACTPFVADGEDWDEKAAAYALLECSPTNHFGVCPTGNVCRAGTCVEGYPIVETNTSLSQVQYISLFGMLLTGIGLESNFYSQLNVYKLGSGETTNPGEGYVMVQATDPFTGEIYAANMLDCQNPLYAEKPMCNPNNYLVEVNGGAQLVLKLAREAKLYEEAFDVFMDHYQKNYDAIQDSTTPEHREYLVLVRKWSMAKYSVTDVIRNINWIRGVHDIFGTLF